MKTFKTFNDLIASRMKTFSDLIASRRVSPEVARQVLLEKARAIEPVDGESALSKLILVSRLANLGDGQQLHEWHEVAQEYEIEGCYDTWAWVGAECTRLRTMLALGDRYEKIMGGIAIDVQDICCVYAANEKKLAGHSPWLSQIDDGVARILRHKEIFHVSDNHSPYEAIKDDVEAIRAMVAGRYAKDTSIQRALGRYYDLFPVKDKVRICFAVT